MSGSDITSKNATAPPMFKVMLLNDKETPMEFALEVLQEVFGKTREEATGITMVAHYRGVGLCGIYSRPDAENLIKQVMSRAREHRHPLQCVLLPT